MKGNIGKLFKITGLSPKENSEIVKYASVGNPNILVIPFSLEFLRLVESIQSMTPFEYILDERVTLIQNVIYTIQNDYILVNFVK